MTQLGWEGEGQGEGERVLKVRVKNEEGKKVRGEGRKEGGR